MTGVPGMRVIALLSGGKDSVCAVEVARSQGWEVVASLAMLPAQDDAWMFHTPNLGVVRAVAQALGLPLVEAPARSGPEAEVADLEAALAAAKVAFRLDGIVSGALASEYQRTRIERIGHRLGLKSLAPLWHKDPAHYLACLLAWDVRFARTAADGVPNAWAAQRMASSHLAAMAAHPARPDLCGEGGEYETLVLDCPAYTRRIVVDKAHIEATRSRATWHVQAWHTEGR